MAYAFPNPHNETLEISSKEGSATISYVIPYGDIVAVTNEVLDPSSPTTHPLYAGLICKSVTATLLGDYTPTSYANRIITLNFGSPEEDESDDLISVKLDIGAESLSLPKDAYKIGTGSPEELGDDQAAPHKIIPVINFVVTQYHLPAINVATIRSLVGLVNNAIFANYPAESVLYEGATSDFTLKTDGTDGYTLSHSFAVHGATWNKHWNCKTSAWEDLDRDLYESGNFATLGVS